MTIICGGKIKRLFLVSLDNSFPFDSRQVKIWICFKYLIPGEGSIFNRCVKNIFAKNYLTCFENGSRTITVSVMRQYASDWRIWYFIWILTFGVIYSQWCVTHVSLTLKTGNPLNKMASFTLKSNYKKKHHFIPKLKRDILTRKIWRNPSCVLRTYFKSQWYYSLVCADQWTCEREIDRYEILLTMGRLSTIVHWLNPVIPLDMTWIAFLWRKRKASLIGLQ